MAEKDLLRSLIRLHVLHHAACEPVFGVGLMDELARHGYRVSPGTLYPILHGLERSGYLRSRQVRVGAHNRRTYLATASGRRALDAAKHKVSELFHELFEDELARSRSPRAAPRDRRPPAAPAPAGPRPSTHPTGRSTQ
jgi:DNA-binding PadR family transcriptional regulator